MGRFDTSATSYLDQAAQPAAPSGLKQGAQAAAGVVSGDPRFADSKTGAYIDQKGMLAAAQSWYTGANVEGQQNGWDTAFWDRMMEQNRRFGEQGLLNTQFDAENMPTGVVTWDHDSSDGTEHFTFGDVYDNGDKVGNLYDQFANQPGVADLMMADIVLPREEKTRVFTQAEIDENGQVHNDALKEAIQAQRTVRNDQARQFLTSKDFAEKVGKRADEFAEGDGMGTELAIGGAAGTGLVVGGALMATGIGLLPGAIITAASAAAGGTAAWMNQDALVDQAARAYEITSMADRQNGTGAAVAEGVEQWAGFGSKFLSPLSNLTQGTTDWSRGEVGDGTSEFYRTNKKGDRVVPTWVKVADVVGSVGDMALQFASPIGAGLYMTQMSATITGETAGLALTKGKSFDYTSGRFDSIFSDDDGNFSPTQAAAGIGKVGIDVVQLGMARGLLGQVQASRIAVGEEAVGAGGSLGNRLFSRIYGKQPGAEQVQAAGFRFTRDAEGTLTRNRLPALSLLAPSEQLSALSARVIARRTAAKAERGAYTADDFYAAAQAIHSSKWKSALVNGMGEGYEEAVQAVLDPYSHQNSINAYDIGNAALYGFAGGVGMGLGVGARTPNADEKMFAMAQTAHAMQTGGDQLTRSTYDSWSEPEKRAKAGMGRLELATAQAAFDKIIDEQATEMVAGVEGANKLDDAVQTHLKTQLKTQGRVDKPFVIIQIEDAGAVDVDGNLLPGSMPADAVVSSGEQLATNFTNRMRATESRVAEWTAEVDSATQAAAADPANTELAAAVTEAQRRLDQVRLMLTWAQHIDTEITDRLARMYDPAATMASLDAEATSFNLWFRDLFNMNVTTYDGRTLTDQDKVAISRAVSQVLTRDPQDQSGSYPVLVPQVSPQLTASRSNDVLEVSHAILPAIRGDYDGDKVRTQEQLMLDDNQFVNARAGMFYLGAGASVNVKAPKYEAYVVDNMGAAMRGANISLSSYATGMLAQVGTALRNRYAGVVSDEVLDEVWQDFFEAVRSGSKDARKKLLDGLAAKAGGPITSFARGNLSNEWLWIDQLVRATTQQFQEAYAAHRPDVGPIPDTSIAIPSKQSKRVREMRVQDAATQGFQLGLETAGDSMFRKFQKLHYSSLSAAVRGALGKKRERMSLYEQAELYRALSSQVTQAELDLIRGKDDITTRVLAQLQRLAADASRVNPRLDPTTALVVTANMQVADIDVDFVTGEVRENGKVVSLAQLLLRQSVERDRREKDSIYEASPELQAKHKRLLAMTRQSTQGVQGSRPVNAERAFVEVFGSQQLFTLLGDDAMVFGPHLSVEQYVRMYVSRSPRSRRGTDRQLKGDAAYLGRKTSKNPPYSLDEVVGGEVSAYRAVVDAVIAVGHNRVTVDKEGNLHGEFAERSNRTSKAIHQAHAATRLALQRFLEISPRQDGELTVEVIARMLRERPDFARTVLGLIPDGAASAVLEARESEVYVSNWVYAMFTHKKAEQAEMVFWRNILLAQWNAKGMDSWMAEEGHEEGIAHRKFSDLDRRMHRVFYDLHPTRAKDGGVLLTKLLEKMTSSTNLAEFIRWVNTTPGLISAEQAPIVAWVDDTAEFDADKASGGWTSAIKGAELREAVKDLQRAATNLAKDLVEERSAMDADNAVLDSIERVMAADAGDTTVTLAPGDRAFYSRFVKAIDQAGELALGLGPAAMVFQVVGAVRGFYPSAHTKGKNPDYVETAGALEAQRDAFGYTTNYERVLAALTSLNLTAVGNNLGQTTKDDVRTMNDDGRTVVQERPTPASVVALLRNADTRPMARAMLFPQVMERDFDGVMRPKLLVGKNLKSLLDGTSHDDLFPKNDRLSQDAALRYLSMVEAQAREHGGRSHEVQRALNDYVVARTSSADHTLSTYEIEQLTLEAAHQMARILQASGAMASEAQANPNEPDPLAPILTSVRDTQRRTQAAYRLGLLGKRMSPDEEHESELLSETVLNQMIAQRQRETEEGINQVLLQLRSTTDPAEQNRLNALIAEMRADQTAFDERAQMLLSDDLAADVVAMFAMPQTVAFGPQRNPAEFAHAKSAITEYILSNLDVLQKASASLVTLDKLTTQIADTAYSGQPDLSPEEWAELSNAVIGVYIDRVVSTTAAHVSVSPYPDADHRDDHRYYDTSFSYLLTPVLSSDSPLVLAARTVHNRAGRQGEEVTDVDMLAILDDTIFSDFNFGNWTSDIPRASIEANQRLDAASAAPAISMAGMSPKSQAVFSATTRRSFAVPPDSLLSNVVLNYKSLGLSEFDEVDIEMPGARVTTMPVIQLNNRFAKKVQLDIQGGTGMPIDLLAEDRDLGRPFVGDDQAIGSGLYEIHLSRVRLAVERALLRRGLDPMTAQPLVTIDFFHPDSQPAAGAAAADGKVPPTWMHNLYFEGTSFALDADRFESLNASLWFAEGGINPVAQATALDANKLGLPALQVVPTPTAAERQLAEDEWPTDFARMLRMKARLVMGAELGSGRLDPEYYNAVYKNLKMRHFVSGTVDGKRVLWTAEQVIEAQVAGQDLPEDPRLWVPSDDVLRQMLGEATGIPGPARKNRIMSMDLEIDLARVPTFTGVTDQMLDWYANGIAGDTMALAETRVSARARQSQLVVRAKLDKKARDAYDARMLYFAELEEAANTDRALIRQHDQGFDFQTNLARAVRTADKLLRAENISFDWSGTGGVPFIGPRFPADQTLSKMLLHDLEAALEPHGSRTGWIYREGAPSDPPKGVLSNVSLKSKQRPGLRVAPGDLVVVELDYFRGDADLARKRMDYLVNHGAVIVLAEGARNDMRAEIGNYLESLQHGRIAGSVHMYQASDTTNRYANQRARSSTKLEVREVSTRSMISVLNVLDKAVAENSAWVNVGFDDDGNLIQNERLSAIAVSMDLVPTDFLGGFNVPVEETSNNTRSISQVERVRSQLMGLDSPDGRTLLRGMATQDLRNLTPAQKQQADADFDTAYDRMIQRFNDYPGTVLPQPGVSFGTGDLIPLVGPAGQILLYRHGYQAPANFAEVQAMAAMSLPGTSNASNVAVFPSKLESGATTHIGNVASVQPRSGYGLSMELNIDLSLFGDKKVLEWNGMKFLLTPMADSIQLPEHGIFPNWVIDLVASAHDMVSKESTEGLINNHRNAFAYLGVDFMPDVMKFFKMNKRDARTLLDLVANYAPRISVEVADELLNSARLSGAFLDQLQAFTAQSPKMPKVNWSEAFDDLGPVEAQIVSAMIVYLSTPGAQVDAVLRSRGFGDDSVGDDTRSLLMPSLFTEVFDNARIGSVLRTEMNARLNQRLYNPNADGTGYSLSQTWQLEVRNGTLNQPSIPTLTDAMGVFDWLGMSLDVRKEINQINGVDRSLIKIWVRHPNEKYPVALFWWDSVTGEIIDVNVEPAYQRQGIATGLVQYAQAYAMTNGHHQPTHSPVISAAGKEWAKTVPTAPTVTGRPQKNLVGYLQFAEAHSSGDNPIKNGMSFDESESGVVSAHSAWIAYQATGARTAFNYDISKSRVFASGAGLTRFARDDRDGGVWRMLTGIKQNDKSAGAGWRAKTTGEMMRIDLAEEAVTQFRQTVKKNDKKYWSTDERTKARQIAIQIVEDQGLDASQFELVDFWVRQVLGMPAGTDATGADVGRVSGKAFLEAADDIRWNVQHGYFPTMGAEVPLTHLHDVQLIYRANQDKKDGWKPRESMDAESGNVAAWDDWVKVSLGSVLTSDNLFDPMYLLALDGFMHSYQNATSQMMDLPVSMDRLKAQELMDPETSRMIVSLESDTDMLAGTPVMVDTARATLDSLIGGTRIAGKFQSKAAPASEVARRREVRRKWRKENGVPVPLDVSMKNFRKNGAEFVDKGTSANALYRFMINMRVGTALINPALYVSMGPEQWFRGTLDRAANLLVGQSAAGLTGKAAAALRLSTYTPDQVRRFSAATDILGKRNDFKRMVYTELWYLRPHEMGQSKLTRWAESYAKLGSRMQDPTYGMSSKTLARRYLEAAISHIQYTPTMSTLTIDTLLAEMRTNPTYLQNHFPEAHLAGINSIAQLRSLKATPLSLAIRGIYEPMSESTNMATNFLGNVVLKMPLLFSGYAMNVLTTITGMQGLSDMFAMGIEGRKKGPNSFFGRIQAKLRGEDFSPKRDAEFDMSSVLEGVDLTRSFIRGGLTHTGLFMFGLMAGGLGLSGEDDETKKRRRMAELQGAGFIYDPRAIENDFRNKDAIFLDWLPFGLDTYFKVTPGPDGRSMGQLHWMLKQFISPIMGMERFYETGDFSQVTWGFMDAVGSFPLINSFMWDETVETAAEFASMADDEAKVGGPTNMVAAAGLLANGVGVYERMLFENSFVNSLYTSFDRYDRNPYALPQRDSDGTIQRDIEDQPYQQDLALKSFIDPETGQLVRGYQGRDQLSGTLHALTENRATMAFAMSLFSGLGDSDYLRRNMVVKTHSLQKPTVSKEEAEAIVRRTVQLAGGLPSLTADEIRGQLIQRNIAAGVFQQPDVLDAEAAAIAANQGLAPMSVLDARGREVLTKDGARAVYQGIYKGSVDLADASLQGVYISYEMRTEIANDWMKELVQEGVDMGLDQTKATSRMKRIMYGEYGTDQEGLADILFKKPEDGGLSYAPEVSYNQLNTTYVMGPDGRPWATGFTRDGLMGALGLKPFKRAYVSEQLGTTGNDKRLNTTDWINGMNTGLRGLELIDESRYIPTDVEIGKAIEEAIKNAAAQQYAPFPQYTRGGSGYTPWHFKPFHYTPYKHHKYGGYRHHGYPDFGGGGGFYFNRMYAMPRGSVPYGNKIPFINTSNPLLRRADIRRERVWSEHGRLKQWQ